MDIRNVLFRLETLLMLLFLNIDDFVFNPIILQLVSELSSSLNVWMEAE